MPHFSTGGIAPYVAEVFSAIALKTSCYPHQKNETSRKTGLFFWCSGLRAGIPVRFAHSNVVGNLTVPPTNAPLPDRFYEGFPGIAKELLAARRGKFLYV